ncbi:hypothetical protein EDD16DRAFT_1699436 [Pisolithus croceorrhizus]|nr:hypothetical protein EDD16DRAFT_1699436 [Pisolithus croceorrhizus]
MPQQQQIHLGSYPPWDDLQVPGIQFQYASSSLSSALVALPPATSELALTHYEYSSAPASTFTSEPSTSTSPVSHPVDFVMTTATPTSVYEDDARQYDQLHRHTPPRDYYITPATHEDRRMPHCQPSYPHQHPERIHPSLQRSDLLYQQQLQQTNHSYASRDLTSRPPTRHDVHYAQQQSENLVSHSPRPSSQPDLRPLADQSYPLRLNHTLHSYTAPHPHFRKLQPQLRTQNHPPPWILRKLAWRNPMSPACVRNNVLRPPAPRKRPDTQAQLRLSSDLPATSDPSIKPYACGLESCWPANAPTSRACYSTSRGLSDHNKAAHPDDVGSDRPYRCGLDGCSKSWKSINGLQYHLQISKAHFQHAITSTYLTPYMEGLSVPASVEASTSGQTETKRKQYACPHENCPNRYKQLSGLRYHLAHGHPADLPAQLDLVPPALSRKLEEKRRMQSQAQGSSLVTRAPTSGHPQQP